MSVEIYIWSRVFPNEEIDYDTFYDWCSENSNYALKLSLEYCNLKKTNEN